MQLVTQKGGTYGNMQLVTQKGGTLKLTVSPKRALPQTRNRNLQCQITIMSCI